VETPKSGQPHWNIKGEGGVRGQIAFKENPGHGSGIGGALRKDGGFKGHCWKGTARGEVQVRRFS